MASNNIASLIRTREIDATVNQKFQNTLQVYDSLIKRLGLITQLEGHEGCVNCLEWNRDGRFISPNFFSQYAVLGAYCSYHMVDLPPYIRGLKQASILASGSDDLDAIIWDPHHRKVKYKVKTGHTGNIFSVKFVLNTDDHVLATGAADSQVRVHCITAREPMHVFKCHGSRVKQMATCPQAPHLLWSASEDGTVRQFDLRESHVCDARGEACTNILIDLNLHVGRMCEAKCIEVNPCQSEMLAVGANDPFVRIYDRRMLAQHGASQLGVVHCSNVSCPKGTATLPPDTASYYSPGHLPSSRRVAKRPVVATHLTFGATGRELLVNLGSEQVYLFDVRAQQRPLRYTADYFTKDNITKDNTAGASRNGLIHTADASSSGEPLKKLNTNGYHLPKQKGTMGSRRSGETRKTLPPAALLLKGEANAEFEHKNYWAAINLYNQALGVAPESAVLYANRAAAFLKRAWYGDVYAALRDCHKAIALDATNSKACYRQGRCLFELGWYAEADACLRRFKTLFPNESTSKLVMALEKDIATKISLQNEGDVTTATPESGASKPKKSDGGRKRRTTNAVTKCEQDFRNRSLDYNSRFCGHCNTITDIKQANFFGVEGKYIVAGSDDGSFFIWDKESTNLMRVLKGDDSIVNCLQPHPSTCILATSGIGPVVRLWGPCPEEDEAQHGLGIPDNEFAQVARENQRRMKTDPFELMLLNLGYPASRGDERGTSDEESDGESGVVPLRCHPS